MNIFEKHAAKVIVEWRKAADANGGFTLELAEKLLADVLAAEGRFADASELQACRHERSLVAEELFLALTALGIGPDRRHSPENTYSADHRRRVGSEITAVIGDAGQAALEKK